METFSSLLQTAINNGELLKLAYAGGSRPGAERMVYPISLSSTELAAREPNSKIRKQYKFDKILWIENKDGVIYNNPAAAVKHLPDIPSFDSLSEYADYLSNTFENNGWHVHSDENFFGVGGFFKNGKPKKSTIVSICFNDRSWVDEFDSETGEFITVKRELTGRERPWYVTSVRFDQGKTYRDLHTAIIAFIEEVKACNP